MNNLEQSVPKLAVPPMELNLSTHLREVICECVSNNCTESFGLTTSAIVLTGSLARDEATFIRKEEMWQLVGDAEFMVVFEKQKSVPSLKIVNVVRQRIEDSLKNRGIDCIVDLGVVTPSYFRCLPPHIFTYELKACGRVIFGDDRLLHLIPDFSMQEISLEDGWRLLCNRLIEVLECTSELSLEANPMSAKLQYRVLKLYLDMATSLLVFSKAYAPTYRERQIKLRELASDGTVYPMNYPFEIGKFADVVDACTDQKLAMPGNPYHSLDLTWISAVRTAHLLWRWELANLTNTEGAVSDSQLVRRFMSSQSLREKIRGWASVVRSCGWLKSRDNWIHWLTLIWKATPRYWIYYVATSLLFQRASESTTSAPGPQIEDWSTVVQYLPVRKAAKGGRFPLSWKDAVLDTVWNYREFLVGTRA